jgi:hypothetical protein
MQGYMQKSHKKQAASPNYVSPNQLTFEGFQSPYEHTLNSSNRWVVVAKLIRQGERSFRNFPQAYCHLKYRSSGYEFAGGHWFNHNQALMQSG